MHINEELYFALRNQAIPQLVRKFRSYLFAKYGECDLPVRLAAVDLRRFSALLENFDMEDALGTEMFANIIDMEFTLGPDWGLNVNVQPVHEANRIQINFLLERGI